MATAKPAKSYFVSRSANWFLHGGPGSQHCRLLGDMRLYLCHGHDLQRFHLHFLTTEVTMPREEYTRLLYEFIIVDVGAELSEFQRDAALRL